MKKLYTFIFKAMCDAVYIDIHITKTSKPVQYT